MYLFCCCFFFFCSVQLVGSQFSNHGLNMCPLHQECGILTSGPLGKFPIYISWSLSLTLMRIPIRSMYVKFTPIFTVVVSLSVEYSLPHYFILSILNSLREFVLGFSSRKKCLAEKLICFFLYHHNNNLNDCNSWPSHHQPGSLESNLMPNQINYVNNVNMFAFSSFAVLFSISILWPLGYICI